MSSSYRDLVNRHAVAAPADKTQEDQLDSLLEAMDRKKEAKARAALEETRPEPLDAIRRAFREIVAPALQQVAEKYADKGITLTMDASDLLSGGRKVLIEAAFDSYQLRLDGTAVPEGVAFQESRSSNNVGGELTSGPMLRARGLTAERARDFVCERVALLVRAALRRR